MRGRGRVVGPSLCKHAGMEVEMVVVVVVVGLNGQRQSPTDDWSLGLTFDIHMAPNVDYLRNFDGRGWSGV